MHAFGHAARGAGLRFGDLLGDVLFDRWRSASARGRLATRPIVDERRYAVVTNKSDLIPLDEATPNRCLA